MSYNFHPDFKMLSGIHPPLNRASVAMAQKLMGMLFLSEKSDETIQVERVNIPVSADRSVRALLYTPRNRKASGSFLDIHGGGYAFPAAPYHYKQARIYAREAGYRVLFPDYRLAPAHPFPAAPEDCFAVYRWLTEHSEGNIAVGGDSAGATLAMAVCLHARETGLPMPSAQLLIYPSVGNCGGTESVRLFTDTPMCNSKDMAQYGKWYVPDPDAGNILWRSPIEAESLEGIPMTYIETAMFDALRDGGILYAEKLKTVGIPVELHQTEGTVHGYDMVMKSPLVQDMLAKRVDFLKRALNQ